MFDGAAPIPLDYQLPADAYYHLVRTLRLTLPPPPTDSADDLRKRDHAAIARITALAPGNSVEADVAAQFVAASEQWKDCLRLAQLPETTLPWAVKCRAQAASMMRQANSALRLLLRMQEVRRKLEADNAACNRAAWTEHCAAALMAEALAGHSATSPGFTETPPPRSATSGDVGATPPAAPAGCPEPAVLESRMPPRTPKPKPEPLPEPEPASVAELEPDLLDAAEEYAVIYPERAALIRRAGRLPDDISFGPPDEDIVQALITARTPALVALDRGFPQARAT